MKTPEEWTSKFNSPHTNCDYWIDLFKQIQLDAWQQGMLDAAIHCTNVGTKESIHISNQLLALKDTKK